MNLKFTLGLCTAFLMILSSDARSKSVGHNPYSPVEKSRSYRNFHGIIIEPHHHQYPSELCDKALKNSSFTYWITSPHERMCSNLIRCSNPPHADLILTVRPENGVVCETQSVCINGKCQYLLPKDDEASSSQARKFKDYHGRVIDFKSNKHPNELCREYFNDAEASWRNSDSHDSCSRQILCYKPKWDHVDKIDKKPESGVLINDRTICLDGKHKTVEPFVPEDPEKDRGRRGEPVDLAEYRRQWQIRNSRMQSNSS